MSVDIIFWYWWVAAVLMLGIEMLSPGFLFLWMAISAFIIGLIVLVFPMIDVEIQLFMFSILSMSSVIIWKRYMVAHPIKTDHPYLNKRNSEYIGRTFILVEAIKYGRGKIRINDSNWKVEGDDCPIGSKVLVTAINGNFLKVKLVDAIN